MPGTLVFRNGMLALERLTRNGRVTLSGLLTENGSVTCAFTDVEAGETAADDPQQFDGVEVDFALHPNQQNTAYQITPHNWQPRPPSGPPRDTDRGRRGQAGNNEVAFAFRNPYNFVPTSPRGTGTPLADESPAGHDRFVAERWSGTISCTLATVTPLLLPDTVRGERNADRHASFPVARDRNGAPALRPTAVRGMLRSAFETVTNSRYGVFDTHDTPLAYRQTTQVAPRMVPARVETVEGNTITVALLNGWTRIPNQDQPQLGGNDVQYAAWLPTYRQQGQANVRYRDGTEPGHGDEVVANVSCEAGGRGVRRWVVTTIVRRGQDGLPEANEGERRIEGWVYRTGWNIAGKHDERVFFVEGFPEVAASHDDDDVPRRWRGIIASYRQVLCDDLQRVGVQSCAAPHDQDVQRARPQHKGAVPSAHVNGEAWQRLQPGSLCFVTLQKSKGTVRTPWRVTGAYPVMIGREAFAQAPRDCLDPSLRPARDLQELSPADRVFGWVAENESGAYRSHLRVAAVSCATAGADAIEEFRGEGLALAILSAPKPVQARFYAATDRVGSALDLGTDKGAQGYDRHSGLRGRKVYPHHQGLPDGYWDNPLGSRRVAGFHREYRRVDDTRDSQNRSVQGWVRPDTRFTVRLEVDNLSDVELGALLWLADLSRQHPGAHHRLGGGKPLGFGSVTATVDWDATRLSRGADLRAAYTDMKSSRKAVPGGKQQLRDTIEAFQQAVCDVYPRGGAEEADTAASFEGTPLIAAFLRAACGFEDGPPMHYPRSGQPAAGPGTRVVPHRQGEQYRWFVANDRVGRHQGPRVSLARIVDDPGLPPLGD